MKKSEDKSSAEDINSGNKSDNGFENEKKDFTSKTRLFNMDNNPIITTQITNDKIWNFPRYLNFTNRCFPYNYLNPAEYHKNFHFIRNNIDDIHSNSKTDNILFPKKIHLKYLSVSKENDFEKNKKRIDSVNMPIPNSKMQIGDDISELGSKAGRLLKTHQKYEQNSYNSNKPRSSEDEYVQDFVKKALKTRIERQERMLSTDELCKFLDLKRINFTNMPNNPIKIGEASFSEVFMVNKKIYKIIPFNEYYGIEAFSKEVVILEALKNQAGICRIYDKFVINGKYNKEYIRAWMRYKKAYNSENENPKKYKKDQIFGVIVMDDCGKDMEKYEFKDYTEIKGFISQILNTIVTLERNYRFEHRDLHWGNIMIKNSKIYLIDFNFARIEIVIDWRERRLCGLHDYTDYDSQCRKEVYEMCSNSDSNMLTAFPSAWNIGNTNMLETGSGDAVNLVKAFRHDYPQFNLNEIYLRNGIIYTDLKDENWIFEGDSSVDLQFEIYKKMKISCMGNWELFNKKSNLLWISYLLDKLFLKVKSLKVNEDKYKCIKMISKIIDVSNNCDSASELLDFFKNNAEFSK